MQKTLARMANVLERFKKEYPDEVNMIFKDHDRLFAEYGWYVYDGSTVEDVLIISKFFNQGKTELAEGEIKKIFNDSLEEIESDLTKNISESKPYYKRGIHLPPKSTLLCFHNIISLHYRWLSRWENIHKILFSKNKKA